MHTRKNQSILQIVILSLMFLYTVSSVAKDQDLDQKSTTPIIESHHQSTSSCYECHKDTQSKLFKTQMQKNCITCHKLGWSAPDKMETAARSFEPPNHTPTKAATGKGPGMSTPMYYNSTRIGTKPNPMSLIPKGTFIRGTDHRLPDEGPQHNVQLDAFYIDIYEVTNAQYKIFMDEKQREAPKHFVNGAPPQNKLDHPVTHVSWYDAKSYCKWAGKRLPTDKEWEKAARGTDGRTYPWGEEFDINNVNSPVRWTTLDLVGDTTPVGTFESGKSPYGLYDTSGNVWEWTASKYEAYPGNQRSSENYGGNYRVLKGGSWWDCSFYQCGISAPLYNRSFFHPKTKNNSFGFRCAKDVNK